jgi:chromosome segregation ATPase
MRQQNEQLKVSLKSADIAQNRAEEEAADNRRLLHEFRTQTQKSGAMWENMLKAKTDREQEVTSLKKQLAEVEAAKMAADMRIESLEAVRVHLEGDIETARRRVRVLYLLNSMHGWPGFTGL